MAGSLLCAIALILYYIGIVKMPRRQKENGFEVCIVGTVLLLSLTGVAALLFTVVRIPVNLVSISAAILLMAVVLWGSCIRKKEFSKCSWPLHDAVSLLLLAAVVVGVAINNFGINLKLNYIGLDAPRYFRMAMELLERQTVSGEFLTDLLNAMFISFVQPFLAPISYYKGMIAADIFMHILSVFMFYLLLSKINRKNGKYWNVVLTIMYFGGYQLYNLNGWGFMHWVDGMLMVMFVIYSTLLLMQESVPAIQGILYLLLGLFGVICFYPILMIVVVPMLLPEAVLWCRRNMRHMQKKTLMVVGGLLLLLAGGTLLVVGQRVNHSWDSLLYSLTATEGPAPRQPYLDFLLFVPVFAMLLGLLHKHKEENRSIVRMLMMASLFTLVWLFFLINGSIVGYYYYRVYYVLWLLAWLMTGQTVSILISEKRQIEVWSYAVFFAVVLFISIGKPDEKLWDLSRALYTENAERETDKPQSVELCPLYTSNVEELLSEHESSVSEAEYGIYAYVYENYQDETVPMVASVYMNIHAEWYRGITGQRFHYKYFDEQYYSLYRILHHLEQQDIRHMLILKGQPLFTDYYEEVFSHFKVVVENEGAVIYERPENNWCSVIKDTDNITAREKNFFKTVSKMEIRAPLVYDMYCMEQAKYYAIYTSGDIDSWIHGTLPEDFIANTYRLNIDETEYLAVLKKSEIYKQNKKYFDAQKIVYENDAGMLIQHAGTGWMPAEQE